MKTLSTVLTLFVSCIFLSCNPEDSAGKRDLSVDENAVATLDSLSKKIGELNSCSYTLNTIIKEKHNNAEMVEVNNEHDVYMRGPNKMYIHTKGTKGRKSFWYNGTSVAYYSYDKNVFDSVPAPSNIIAAIDTVSKKFGIDFPATDFFYPTFTDDVLRQFNIVEYTGEKTVGDLTLHEITASNDSLIFHVLVDQTTSLPYQFELLGRSETIKNSYSATFSHWQLDPQLPDVMFEFKPSADAIRVKLGSND
jgi:hypothetical protein